MLVNFCKTAYCHTAVECTHIAYPASHCRLPVNAVMQMETRNAIKPLPEGVECLGLR
jgi:hypothetical protein